jgi:hypothetical protein
MTIESEYLRQAMSLHQNERGTIRKAHFLVRVLPEEIQGLELDLLGWPKDLQAGGSIEGPHHLRRQAVPGSSCNQVCRLIEHEVAGGTASVGLENLAPDFGGYLEVLIISYMAGDESSSVDKDQSPSP